MDSCAGKIPWRRDRLPTAVFLNFPCDSAGKESVHNAGDLGSISELGRPPGEGKGYPLQYSGLENFMDCTVHGVTKSRTRLSDFHTCRARGTSLLLPRRRIHEVCSLDSCKRDRPPASPSSLGLLSKVLCPQVPAIDHHGDGVPGCPGWALLLC